MGYILTMGYYVFIKSNEVQKQSIMWTNLEKIMLSESSQMRKGQILYYSMYVKRSG